MWLYDAPLAVKSPPAIVWPSICKAKARTLSFVAVPGSKLVSKLPVALKRATWLRAEPLMMVKKPPTRISPSVCSVMDKT